jgi:hypothetical protein
MNIKSLCLLGLGLLVISAVPAAAQQSLGDLVTEYGYDWLVGKWAATTDNGENVELEYKWGLDRHVILVDFKMGDFKYHGMIMFIPSREEVVQMGADNQGSIWNGTWGDDYNGAAHSMENTKSDGSKEKSEMVHSKVDGNTMKIGVYGTDSYGYRGQSRGTLNMKRQPKK